MLVAVDVYHDLRRYMSVSMTRPVRQRRIIVKHKRPIHVLCKLTRPVVEFHLETQQMTDNFTLDEALIRSHASLYNTVGEFLENSSVVRE